MRRLIQPLTFLGSLVSALSLFAGATCTWTGEGDGRWWNDSKNWQDEAVPGEGDSVVLSNTGNSPVISNNLGELALGKLTVTGANAFTFDGDQVSVGTGAYGDLVVATATALVTVNVHIHNVQPGSVFLALNQYVDLAGGFTSVDVPSGIGIKTADAWATAKISGLVDVGTSSIRCYPKSNGTLELSGGVICDRLRSSEGGVGNDAGMVLLSGTNNQFGQSDVGFSGIKCGKVNVMPEAATIRFGGGWSQANFSVFDMNGKGQTVDRIFSEGSYAEAGQILKSSSAARLVMNATADALVRCEVQGKVSLVWNPADDHEVVFSNRTHTTSGDIVVSNGTFTVGGTASFANVANVCVADNARLRLNSATAASLAGVRTLAMGANAKVVCADGTPLAFADNELSIDMTSTSELHVQAGVTLHLKALTIDGLPAEGGDHTGGGAIPQITGGGTVVVPYVEVPTKELSWTAGGGADESVATADNWQEGFVPSDLKARSLQAHFGLAGTQAVFAASAAFKGLRFGLPASADDKSFALSGEQGAVLALHGLGIAVDAPTDDATYRYAVNLPLVIREDATWTVPSAQTALEIRGSLSGEGNVVKTGKGGLDLHGVTPAFTGGLEVRGGLDSCTVQLPSGTTNVLVGPFRFATAEGAQDFGYFNVASDALLVTSNSVYGKNVYKQGGGTWVCRGPFGIYYFGISGGRVVLETSSLNRGDGAQPSFRLLGADAVLQCTIDNQLNENWNSVVLDRGTFDLNGHDQKVGGLNLTGNTVDGAFHSEEPATLSVHGYGLGTFTLKKADFTGALSFNGPLLASAVFTVDRAVSSTGSLSVPAGTFAFTENGSWTNAPSVSVGGTLKVSKSKTFGSKVNLFVSEAGVIDLAAGVRQRCASLTIDGEECEAGTWGGPNAPSQHHSERLSGSGVISVGGGLVLIFR